MAYSLQTQVKQAQGPMRWQKQGAGQLNAPQGPQLQAPAVLTVIKYPAPNETRKMTKNKTAKIFLIFPHLLFVYYSHFRPVVKDIANYVLTVTKYTNIQGIYRNQSEHKYTPLGTACNLPHSYKRRLCLQT